uniref:Phosphomannomutase n=1 Tax=Cyamopsis tetragonoloba TaxID=3832 RepID=A0A678QR86_CYATE|nr:phosphomannomutase [Cyamopsis tetragonoloba]
MMRMLSYFSNSYLSSWLQFHPIGETFSIPLRNSINVPLLIGISRSAM